LAGLRIERRQEPKVWQNDWKPYRSYWLKRAGIHLEVQKEHL